MQLLAANKGQWLLCNNMLPVLSPTLGHNYHQVLSSGSHGQVALLSHRAQVT